MVVAHASKEVIWLCRLCSIIGLVQCPMEIDCYSQSAIFLAKNPMCHSKTMHINVQYHFVRAMVEEKKVLLVKVDTLKNVANSLKKSVSVDKFSSWAYYLRLLIIDSYTPLSTKKTTSGKMFNMWYSSLNHPHALYIVLSVAEGSSSRNSPPCSKGSHGGEISLAWRFGGNSHEETFWVVFGIWFFAFFNT